MISPFHFELEIEEDDMDINAIYKAYAKKAIFQSAIWLSVFAVCLILSVNLLGTNKALGSETKDYKRIVSIGGSVTEIIFALGEQDRLIARDNTSVYPEQAFALPDVGYIRRLSPEGVLSVNPDLILAMEGSGPPEAIDTLKEANVPIVFIPEGYTGEKISEKIMAVGQAINAESKAELLAKDTSLALEKISTRVSAALPQKKVLFILSLRGGKILSSGQNTAADGIIDLAGGENIITEFEGYKQISDEAVISAAPEVILMMNARGDHGTSDEQVFSHPAIAATPAGQNQNIIRMDGLYMLGFGPRTAEAATELFEILSSEKHPE